jgi:carboxypeptidase family protein
MSTMRALSGRGLLAAFCSMLLVYQPASGFPGGTRGGVTSNEGAPGDAPASIALAKLTGSAERNGQPLVNGSLISSGDSLQTHANSAVLLTSTPEERVWLGPNTSATLTKDAGKLAVSLERGTVSFESRGRIQVTLQSHQGLTFRSRAESAVRAQLSLVDHQQAQVKVQQGALELVRGDHAVLLQPNQPSSRPARGQSGQLDAEVGSISGTVVNSSLFAVGDAKVTLTNSAGKALTTQSDQVGKFTFGDLAPGTYTLHVDKAGFEAYDLPNVTVRGGNESSLYVQLSGGGAKQSGSNSSILLWVIVGGAAAGGIGAYLGTRGSKSTTSPSSLDSVE